MGLINSGSKSNRLLASRRFTSVDLNTSQEAFASTIDIQASEVYTEANLIPTSSLPFSGSSSHLSEFSVNDHNIVKYYFRQRLTPSNIDSDVWFFLTPTGSSDGVTPQLIDSGQQTNFISPKYSVVALANANAEDDTPGYGIRVFKSTSLNSGSLGGGDVVSSNDFQFDFKTGVLQFNENKPSSNEIVYMTAYQYVGTTLETGLQNTGTGSFNRIELTTNISGSSLSTASFGNLFVDGNISASGIVRADSFESRTGGQSIDFKDSINVTGNLTASGDMSLDDITASGNISGSITSTGSFGIVKTSDDRFIGDLTEIIRVTVVSDGGSKYAFEGATTPDFVFEEGKTYRFDQSDSSNSFHPFRFSTTINGSHGGGSEYTTNVTTAGTPGSDGSYVEIKVTKATVNHLYYYCTNHSGMGNDGLLQKNDFTNLHKLSGSLVSTASFGSIQAVTDISATKFSGKFLGAVSQSTQIATEISGAFTADSSSFALRATQATASIAGLKVDSGSFSTRVTALKADSASFSTRVTTNESKLNQDVKTDSNVTFATIRTTGDIRADGDLIANQLIVSSSVTHLTQSFSSGSTIFGDTLNDTHQFTGSLQISGNIVLHDNQIISSSTQLSTEVSGAFDKGFTYTGDISSSISGSIVSNLTEIVNVIVVSDAGNKYAFEGATTPDFSVEEGKTYRFEQSDSSNSNHPFRFSTTENGSHGGGSAYTTNVTVVGTPGNPNSYTEIKIDKNTPNRLFYYCTNHSGMGNDGLLLKTDLTNLHKLSGSIVSSASFGHISAVTDITAAKFSGKFLGAVSSSTQIGTEISGAFTTTSSSLASRIAVAESELSNTLVSSSNQIATEISGAFTNDSSSFATQIAALQSDSASFSTRFTNEVSGAFTSTSSSLASRLTTAEVELTNTLISSSAAIATEISGAFTSTSASLALSISNVTQSLTQSFSDGTATLISGSVTSTGSFGNITGDRLDLTGGYISIKNQGIQSQVRLYCEVNNAHYVALQAPAHADFGGNVTITLPSTTDTLVGRTTTDTLTNKTLSSPTLSGTIVGNVSASITSTGSFGALNIDGGHFTSASLAAGGADNSFDGTLVTGSFITKTEGTSSFIQKAEGTASFVQKTDLSGSTSIISGSITSTGSFGVIAVGGGVFTSASLAATGEGGGGGGSFDGDLVSGSFINKQDLSGSLDLISGSIQSSASFSHLKILGQNFNTAVSESAAEAGFGEATNTVTLGQLGFFGSGSAAVNVDAGIIVQSGSTVDSGSSLYHDTQTERWAVSKNVGKNDTAITPLEFVATAKIGSGAPADTDKEYGQGEIYVDNDSGDIFIYA